MKIIFVWVSLVMAGMLTFSASAQTFSSESQLLARMRQYSVEDVKDDVKRIEDKQSLKIDEMFTDLEAAVKFHRGKKISENAAIEVQRVVLITLIHDSTSFAVKITLPLYEQNKRVFRRSWNQFHPVDREYLSTLYPAFSCSKYGDIPNPPKNCG